MNIFGYKKKTVNKSGLLEMGEVTFLATPRTLRAIAKFINNSADLIEIHGDNFDHAHLQDEWKEWQETFPDIIVAKLT